MNACRIKHLLAAGALGLLCACLSPVRAQTSSTANASYSGWYDSTGFHNPANQNYLVGTDSYFGPLYRNFFVFPLSGTLEPWQTAVGATLVVPQGVTVTEYPYHPFFTYELYDVSTPIASLEAGGSDLKSTYKDLGSGTPYGDFHLDTDYAYGQPLSFTLDAAAVDAINADPNGYFVIGGKLSDADLAPGSLGGKYGYKEETFAATDGPGGIQLRVTAVPEAGTLSLVGAGAVFILGGVLTRRRQTSGRY